MGTKFAENDENVLSPLISSPEKLYSRKPIRQKLFFLSSSQLPSLRSLLVSASTVMFVFFFLFFFLFSSPTPSSSSTSSFSSRRHVMNLSSTSQFQGYTAISDFRIINRRLLIDCPDLNPYLEINITNTTGLSNDQNVTVTISGILHPADSDWVAMISPSNADVSSCPLDAFEYQQTGDFGSLPLLCHYPVKAQYMKNDPEYLGCGKKECQINEDGNCLVSTCSGSLTFHVVNIRTNIEFVFFAGGFHTPCILRRSSALNFTNPKAPLYGHLSSIDSSGTSMKLTWVSGDAAPQRLQYGNGKSEISNVTTFAQTDMCTSDLPSPASDFGWHDPGYIHSALMTGLQPTSDYSYRYGSDSVGWSEEIQFQTPPAVGSNELTFLAYGDMGKAPHDQSIEHYIQPGSLSVIGAMADEVATRNIDSVFHIGDISYATGFLVEWDFFLHLIHPVASHVTYMTAIGNHERDYIDSGSVYITADSGGECGVAYETYFPMPTSAKDKPWYSIEQASVHFTVISTEHNWSVNSEQYNWMKKDLGSVNRSITPWVVFAGHRPMYSSVKGGLIPSVDTRFVEAVEPLLLQYKVDLVLWGHVHNYERTCAVYRSVCKGMPSKDADGIDVYDNNNYTAPVHTVIGMAGFTLDNFTSTAANWSLIRISKFGYFKVHATRQNMTMEFVNSHTKEVEDNFRITK